MWLPLNEPHMDVTHFEIVSKVGEGTFGNVMLVRHMDRGWMAALKTIRKSTLTSSTVARVLAEKHVLQQVCHPFIVKVFATFETERHVAFLMQFMYGGELLRLLHKQPKSRFSEDETRFYMAEVILAMSFLHSHSIMYRDLKMENVLLDHDGHVRLADFSLVKEGMTESTHAHSFCGTPEYMAPEVILGLSYTLAADWWSIGCLLHEMLTGLPPFFSSNRFVLMQSITDPRRPLVLPHRLSQPANSLCRMLLDRNPYTRLGSLGGGDAVMRHPFFASLDWDVVKRRGLKPPFPPRLENAEDVSAFDERIRGKRVTMFDSDDGHPRPMNDPFHNFAWSAPGIEEHLGISK